MPKLGKIIIFQNITKQKRTISIRKSSKALFFKLVP